MQWAPRVRRWQIRRLYRLSRLGIYDDEILLEVGWGLFVRCQNVLTVVRAVGGEVPCPECGALVYRDKYQRSRQQERVFSSPRFPCPSCNREVSWSECREALRNHPRCLECLAPLDWNHVEGTLSCLGCKKVWTWQQYRQPIKYRTQLPCVHCGRKISRPKALQSVPGTGGDHIETSVQEELTCPHCGGVASHTGGKFLCSQCGYERSWAAYRERLKRRVERLRCMHCGHAFTWQAWRRHYQDQLLLTGNPVPVEEFLSKWPACRTPHQQIIQIDILLYALHGGGALAPLFIEGDEVAVKGLLDELARN